MKNRKICVVTGSRAEYGLLHWLLKDLQAEPKIDLQLVVTGMHLSSQFGSIESISISLYSIAGANIKSVHIS